MDKWDAFEQAIENWTGPVPVIRPPTSSERSAAKWRASSHGREKMHQLSERRRERRFALFIYRRVMDA